ncbi:MAG: nucleotidyltransferase family protein [Lactococcus plantarum]|nr:nucleotidyltransferase family protein [Lactococcus plantarum]MDN6070015.1 nucleotidyltransferase family protein [Lactococcus plantarum]MDN6084687.1 nucleotidyltransferase family protein [Lactococcus plantarum]
MEILTIIRNLALADSCLAAGCIRNLIWNFLSGKSLFDEHTDVDVIFFDQAISYEETQALAEQLKRNYPNYDWELKNQAHMHLHNPNTLPYLNSSDAIARFPETCTAIGAFLTDMDQLTIVAPYGLADIVSFIVRPTPYFTETPDKLAIYRARLTKKNWQEKWPNLKIVYE